jgi:hypothetical protein
MRGGMRGGMSLIRSLIGIRPISHIGAGAVGEILLYVVELKSSLRRRLERYTHARRHALSFCRILLPAYPSALLTLTSAHLALTRVRE